MTEASMISSDCNLEHLANSFNMARVHISSFNEVIVLFVASCLWQGIHQSAPFQRSHLHTERTS